MRQLTLLGPLAILFTSASARGDIIVQDASSITTAFGFPPEVAAVGQTFTAVDEDIRTISFSYEDWSPLFGDATKTVSLLDADNEIIAQRSRDLAGLSGWADFDFFGVSLVPGAQYSIVIASVSARGAFTTSFFSDLYAGGSLWLNGTEDSSSDLFFRVLAAHFCFTLDNGDGTVSIACPGKTPFTISSATCTVIDNGNGTATLSCPDGTQVTITDGADGTTCSVADNGDGTATISCTDGTSATVSNGIDGTSCSVTNNGDGTVTISCTDGTSVTVADGTDGSSCSVVDNGDGTKTISCTDGTSVTVADGTDGSSCSVADNGDGTKTISCTDGTSVTVQTRAARGGGCSTAPGSAPSALCGLLLLGLGCVVRRRRPRAC